MSLSRKQLEALRRQVRGGEGDEEREAVRAWSPGSALAETSRGSSSAIAAADPTQADPARVTEIAAVLGKEILGERAKVLAVLRSQNEVRDLSMQVFEGQINIGRTFGALRPTLSPDEYRRLIDRSDRLYGAHLTRSTVVKLIAVADAVDRPRFPVKRLPRAYTLIYEFAAMGDSLLVRAEAARLIKPDVTAGPSSSSSALPCLRRQSLGGGVGRNCANSASVLMSSGLRWRGVWQRSTLRWLR